jgi:hypothetical protein
MRHLGLRVLACIALLAAASVSYATSYTQNSNLSSFTSQVNTYATFTSYLSGDVAPPYTPTNATVAAGLRVIGTGVSPTIVAVFPNAVSSIIVFPNIDHFGSQYDGYQYTISGSNDGISYTQLFDAVSVVGAVEPFQLGMFTGTAPYLVNNVLTPGAGPGGTVGYEAFFSFSQAYKWYAFGASTVAVNQGNADQELSAVATPTPEPGTLVMFGSSIIGLFGALRRKINL